MGRLILFLVIAVIAGVIAISKAAVGKVTGSEELMNTTLKGEAKNVMDKTASGISWMEAQWEESKNSADDSTKKISDRD